MKKYDLYREERDKGLKYDDIAKKYGVSRQTIWAACAQSNPRHFQPFDESRCPYPGLRRWLNENKITIAELMRRMGLENCGCTHARIRDIVRGKTELKKTAIDKLIRITGMEYKELFG